MLFLMFLFACTVPVDVADAPTDTALDLDLALDLARRTTITPPRILDDPSAADNAGDEAPCSAGEERWVRTTCLDLGFPSSPGWDESRGEWVCPRCSVNVCGAPYYSDYLEREVLPSRLELRTCPARRIPAVR